MKKLILGVLVLVLVILIAIFSLLSNKNKFFFDRENTSTVNSLRTDLCKNIDNRVSKRACYMNEAVKTHNPELCDMLPYTQEEFNEITSGPIYQHSDITDCYRKIAKSLKNPEICNQIDKFDKPLGTILADCKNSALK